MRTSGEQVLAIVSFFYHNVAALQGGSTLKDIIQTNTYGYVRVSTKEQNEERQIIALKKKLIKKLKPGDTVVFKSIDRLGRNFYEILEQWKLITVVKQAYIVILDMPILDTRHQRDDLTSQLISTLVLQLLSYVAEIERDFIKQRQSEGIAAAKARGIKFGRDQCRRLMTLTKFIISGKIIKFLLVRPEDA